jgi:hypothetical protein
MPYDPGYQGGILFPDSVVPKKKKKRSTPTTSTSSYPSTPSYTNSIETSTPHNTSASVKVKKSKSKTTKPSKPDTDLNTSYLSKIHGDLEKSLEKGPVPKVKRTPEQKEIVREVKADRQAWKNIFKPTKNERLALDIADEMRGQVSDFAFADFVGSIVDSRYPRIEQETYGFLNKEGAETAQDLSNYSDALFEGDDDYLLENPLDLSTPKLPIPKGQGVRHLLKLQRQAIRSPQDPSVKSALVQGYGEQIEHLQSVQKNIKFNKSFIRSQVQSYLNNLNDNANYRDEEDISYGLTPQLAKYIKKNRHKLTIPEGKDQAAPKGVINQMIDEFLHGEGIDPDTVPEDDKTPPRKLDTKSTKKLKKIFGEDYIGPSSFLEGVEGVEDKELGGGKDFASGLWEGIKAPVTNLGGFAGLGGDPRTKEVRGDIGRETFDEILDKEVAETKLGEGLRTITDEGVGDPLYWAIDKLSRPLYGTVHGLDTWNAGDKSRGTDKKERGFGAFLNTVTFGGTGALEGLTGTNPGNSVDDVFKDPGLAARAIGDAWKGFSEGGWGDNAKDPMTFGNLIANNAERDPSLPSIYRNKQFQIWGGLAGDVVFDPLNLAGVGIVTAPVRTVKGAADTRKLMNLSKDLSREINTAERIGPQPRPEPTSAQELFELMGGSKSWHRSAADKSTGTVEVEENIRKIQGRLDNAIHNIPNNNHVQRMELLKNALQKKRQAVLDQYGADVVRSGIIKDLKLDASKDGKPFAEAIQEIDDIVTTQRVKQFIPDAIKEANYLDEIAKKAGYLRKNKKGEETKYGSWTEAQRELKALEKTNPERYGLALKQLEDAEVRVQGTYPEGAPVGGRDLYDSLGPEFRQSLGATEESKRGTFSEVMGLVRTRTPYADEFAKLNKQIIPGHKAAVSRAESALKTAKEKGKGVAQAEARLRTNKNALAHAEDRLHTIYADAYINRLKAKRIEKDTGQKQYRNDEKAAIIQQARDRANEELAQIASGEKVNTSHTGIESLAPDKLTGEQPRIQFNDLDELFAPDASFDRTSQLTRIRDEANRQLKGLETPFAGKPIDIDLAQVPEEFLTDGLFDVEKLFPDAVIWDSFEETFRVPSHLEGHAREWANNIAKVLQDTFNTAFKQGIDNLRSKRTNEVYEQAEKLYQEGLTPEQSAEFVKLEEMFAPNGNITSPAITLGDERIILGKPGNKDKIYERATEVDRDNYFAFNKVMSDLTELRHQGKGSFNVNDFSPESIKTLDKLIKYLDESGMALPTHYTKRPQAARILLEHFGNYEIVVDKTKPNLFEVVRGNNKLQGELGMQSIIERRLFKDQHETSLRSAIELKDRHRGKFVTSKSNDWNALYPKGLTRKEFIKEAFQSKSSFQKVTSKGSPFKVDRLATALSNKQRRMAKGSKSPLEMGSQRWVDENYKYLLDQNYDDSIKLLGQIYDSGPGYYVGKSLAKAAENERGKVKKIASDLRTKGIGRITNKDFKHIKDQAFKIAKGQVEAGINKGQLSYRTFDSSLTLQVPRHEYLDDTQLVNMLRKHKGEEYASEKADLLAGRKRPDANLREIDAQIAKLTEKHQSILARLEKYQAEAIEGKKILHKRMNEDALIRTANLMMARDQKMLSWQMLNHNINIPGSQVLFKAMDAVSGVPIIKQTRQVWSNAFQGTRAESLKPSFKAPSKRVPAEMQLAIWRKNGMTPNIIEHHVLELKNTLGKYDEKSRKAAFEAYIAGNKSAYRGKPEVYNAIEEAFDPILPYFQSKVDVAGDKLGWGEIERYLPETFKLDVRTSERGFDSVSDILNAIKKRAMKETDGNPRARTKRMNKIADPYETAWNLRIAIENAQAWKAFDYTVSESFGIKRLAEISKGGEVKNVTPPGKAIEQLTKLGWKPSEQFGKGRYLFPPEIHKDLDTLARMMSPGKEQELVTRTIDSATRYWKTMATIYNPGYWTRNGVGEIMSSWFAGVNDPFMYKHAASVIRYARRDGQELDELTQQLPMLNYIPKESVNPKSVIYTLPDGTKVTPEVLWLGYNDQGLKTGFFNTEFDRQYSKLGDLSRSNPVTRAPAKAHQGLRTTGEWYEDYLRMAHFIHAVKKAPKNMKLPKRFEHAAAEVRKYHFDYTDFTDFEKAVMLRAFPFYKWTRKALPLMVTMLFQKPGKVMAYPKAVNALSTSLTTRDIAQDENGFAPDFEEFTPNWIQDLWGYKIRENDDEAQTNTFFNIATPQMDIYKGMQNPANMAYALSNPLARVPIEQVAGKTLGADLGTGGYDWTFGEFNEEDNDRTTHAMNAVPITNFLNKLNIPQGIVGGDPDDDFRTHDVKGQNIASFLTGMGFWYDDENRRYGEEMRQRNER